jgi:hypothetical protein
VGPGMRLIGVLFTASYWFYADELISIGTISGSAAILFVILKLLLQKKKQ